MMESEDEMFPKCATKLTDLSVNGISQVLSAMVCQVCNRVPYPYKRFLCNAGHVFCGFCGQERFIKHGAKCLIEVGEKEGDKPTKKNEKLPTAVERITMTKDDCLNFSEMSHFPLCQNKLRLYPADPIFTAFWKSATWKCPLYNGACKAVVKGCDLLAHVAECAGIMPGSSIKCAVNGCKIQVSSNDLINHLIEHHDIYAMNISADNASLWRNGGYGLLYIPQSFIEERKPYYTVVRYSGRFFLFCMEPSSAVNSSDMGFWIRLIQGEEEDGEDSCSTYDLFLRNKYLTLEVTYRSYCLAWSEKSKNIIEDRQCLALPRTMLLDQMVVSCQDGTEEPTSSSDAEEKGFLPMNFRIFVKDANDSESDDGGMNYIEEPLPHGKLDVEVDRDVILEKEDEIGDIRDLGNYWPYGINDINDIENSTEVDENENWNGMNNPATEYDGGNMDLHN